MYAFIIIRYTSLFIVSFTISFISTCLYLDVYILFLHMGGIPFSQTYTTDAHSLRHIQLQLSAPSEALEDIIAFITCSVDKPNIGVIYRSTRCWFRCQHWPLPRLPLWSLLCLSAPSLFATWCFFWRSFARFLFSARRERSRCRQGFCFITLLLKSFVC